LIYSRERNQALLQLTNLSVNYGESVILRDVNINVPPGAVVCLLGRNGVGKTTLMKAIMGLLKPQSGSVTYAKQPATQWTASQRARAGFGYVPQGRGIFPQMSVYENLLMGFEALEARRATQDALDEVYTYFPVLRDMRQRLAGTLSGGQQQQLAFARVLVRRPQLLLLDEPTEGIQPSIMAQIEELVLKLHKESAISILLVEQYLDFALSVGNYFYVMETGTIVMEGAAGQFDPAATHEYLSI
jgi:urea transport system ATP-binding protein